ncbi:MAG: sel1 repeat family protein [Alphaproteobacteria bacterium]|nr:sel1 repeat family protein [Alphaproteobacteria bacterium]
MRIFFIIFALTLTLPIFDSVASVADLKVLAEQGDAEAQFKLGKMHQQGVDVPQNNKIALKWYRLSASQEYGKAINNLGTMYQNGHGVRKNEKRAVGFYRKSAEQGLPQAQTNLASMYEEGIAVQKNYDKAIMLYRLAAAQSFFPAQHRLVAIYHTGGNYWIEPDIVRAYMWASFAAELDSKNGENIKSNIAEQMTLAEIDQAGILKEKCQTSNYKNC